MHRISALNPNQSSETNMGFVLFLCVNMTVSSCWFYVHLELWDLSLGPLIKWLLQKYMKYTKLNVAVQ